MLTTRPSIAVVNMLYYIFTKIKISRINIQTAVVYMFPILTSWSFGLGKYLFVYAGSPPFLSLHGSSAVKISGCTVDSAHRPCKALWLETAQNVSTPTTPKTTKTLTTTQLKRSGTLATNNPVPIDFYTP
ncbi:hypothetical protein MPER_13019 [Moniliophthora perniciosa FA553]|nr:hypothetical protein MPER_13019 [Moniliophthora perniciosa FA553]